MGVPLNVYVCHPGKQVPDTVYTSNYASLPKTVLECPLVSHFVPSWTTHMHPWLTGGILIHECTKSAARWNFWSFHFWDNLFLSTDSAQKWDLHGWEVFWFQLETTASSVFFCECCIRNSKRKFCLFLSITTSFITTLLFSTSFSCFVFFFCFQV